VENFTGQTSLANLRNALREEAVVVDELTGLFMSERSLVQELDNIQLMEAGKSEAIDDLSDLNAPFQFEQMAAEQLSLAQLNEAIAANFALHDQVMSWQRSGKGKNVDRLKWYQELAEQAGYSVKGYAPSLETAQWLSEEVGMETEPIATLFDQQAEPQSEELDEEPELEIWVIDQAAGLSSEAMNALLQQTQEDQVRLILIEEPQQNSVKIAGNAFQALQQAGMQTMDVFGASLETLHTLSLLSHSVFKNDPEMAIDIEQTTNDESQTVEIGVFSPESYDGSSFEQESAVESSLPASVEHALFEIPAREHSSSLQENQPASADQSEVVAEFTTSLEQENWADTMLPHSPEQEEEQEEVVAIDRPSQPLEQVSEQNKTTNGSISKLVQQDDPCGICEAAHWEVETIAPEATAGLEPAEQLLVATEKQDRAQFIAQLTDTTIDFFNSRLSQGEILEVNNNVAAVESPGYWLVYHHNQESGETPAFQVQDKVTNSAIFESWQREEGWQAGLVKPEAEAWLEQATQELAASQERALQTRRPQLEL
jgi:AAA domain